MAFIRSGEAWRLVTLAYRRRAESIFARSSDHDLEAYVGVAGEKPRRVCITRTLIARRAGGAVPGLAASPRADAFEGVGS